MAAPSNFPYRFRIPNQPIIKCKFKLLILSSLYDLPLDSFFHSLSSPFPFLAFTFVFYILQSSPLFSIFCEHL